MTIKKTIMAMVLLGASACSSESGTDTQDTPAVAERQAIVANPNPARSKTPHEAARATLPTLHSLVASGNPHHRGFRSVDEAKSAIPADPLPVYMVGLSDLVDFKPGQNARALLMDKEEQVFPLTVEGDARSFMVVRRQPGDVWEPTQFVHGPMAGKVHSGRRDVSKARRVEATKLILIEIPALSMRFLGHEEKGVLMVTPVYDIPGTRMHAGETISAAEAFSSLQPIAANVDPDVPS